MDNLQIMHSNGTPIAIKKGCPTALKSNRINGATCYYAQVATKQYILFQNITIGPFSIWLSDYLFHRPITLSSHMKSSGAEFHQMLEGAAMFSFDKGKIWFRESAGNYNILMNTELHTWVAFTEPPVRTFDIHVDDAYFRELALLHPELDPLVEALDAHHNGALFTGTGQSSLTLRYQLTQVITMFEKCVGDTKATREKNHREILDLLEEALALMVQSSAKKNTPYKFLQTDLDKIIRVKEFIADNFIHPEVLKQATSRHYISKNKLTKGFQILFGHNPKQFVIRKKIEQAKVFMLDVPGASIQEIAMSVGYTDGAYFSQIFSKYEGMRIEDYRRLHLP